MRATQRIFGLASIAVLLLAAACGTKPSEQPTAETKGAAGKPGILERLTATPLTVPAGTVLTVRLNQSVGSRSSSTGDTFTATVAEPITVGDKVAIPKGAEVTGTVAEAVPRGKFKGAARLVLALNSVSVDGKSYPVEAALSRSMKGKGKRTAVAIGGGAALGALIGGIAGGGKGAAIGAAAGGGAGTAGAALTGNKDIVLPAESALSFELRNAVEIKR